MGVQLDEQVPQAPSAVFVNEVAVGCEADEHEKELRVDIQACHVGGLWLSPGIG